MTDDKNSCQPQCETIWPPLESQHVERDILKATISIYKESIIITRRQGDVTTTALISADSLARAFTAHLNFLSGLLPEASLWTKQSPTGPIAAIWRPPAKWHVALQLNPGEPPARLHIPMPGLVFITPPRRPPWVFAAKARPTSDHHHLYNSPTFNTFRDGRVCPGSHTFPTDPSEIPESFFQSYFSMTGDTLNRSVAHPEDLAQLWTEIDGTEEYPLDDLVYQCNVKAAMEIPR